MVGDFRKRTLSDATQPDKLLQLKVRDCKTVEARCGKRFNYVWMEGMVVEALQSLSMSEVLKDVAWRQVVDGWREEAESQSKLVEVMKLIEKECKAQCVEVKCKRRKWILAKLRGGTARLEVEMGRWWSVSREERVCRNCQRGEVEDVDHMVMRCTGR